jgi:cyanate lyase
VCSSDLASRISPGKSAMTDPAGHIGVGSGFHSTSAMYVSMWRRQNEAGSLPPRIADRQWLVELNGASVSSSRSWTCGARGPLKLREGQQARGHDGSRCAPALIPAAPTTRFLGVPARAPVARHVIEQQAGFRRRWRSWRRTYIKREKGWTWKHITEEIGGMSPILVVGALLGQMKLPKSLAEKAGSLFGLSEVEKRMLSEIQRAARRCRRQTRSSIACMSWWWWTVRLWKALIEEEFGDGIMSAIDFDLKLDRLPHPKGDRVQLVMSGKFLPYKYHCNEPGVPDYGFKEEWSAYCHTVLGMHSLGLLDSSLTKIVHLLESTLSGSTRFLYYAIDLWVFQQ